MAMKHRTAVVPQEVTARVTVTIDRTIGSLAALGAVYPHRAAVGAAVIMPGPAAEFRNVMTLHPAMAATDRLNEAVGEGRRRGERLRGSRQRNGGQCGEDECGSEAMDTHGCLRAARTDGHIVT